MAKDGAVLIVEDDDQVRRMMTELLRLEGYEVIPAETGLEAVRVLEEHRPPAGRLSLVLLDLALPEVDGLGVLDHLTILDRYVPVVAISAYPELLTAAQISGVDGLPVKPFVPAELLSAVKLARRPQAN